MANPHITYKSPVERFFLERALNSPPGTNHDQLTRLTDLEPAGSARGLATSERSFSAGPTIGYGPNGLEVGFGFTWKP